MLLYGLLSELIRAREREISPQQMVLSDPPLLALSHPFSNNSELLKCMEGGGGLQKRSPQLENEEFMKVVVLWPGFGREPLQNRRFAAQEPRTYV